MEFIFRGRGVKACISLKHRLLKKWTKWPSCHPFPWACGMRVEAGEMQFSCHRVVQIGAREYAVGKGWDTCVVIWVGASVVDSPGPLLSPWNNALLSDARWLGNDANCTWMVQKMLNCSLNDTITELKEKTPIATTCSWNDWLHIMIALVPLI